MGDYQPAPAGDKVIEHHTEAVMELTQALNEIQPVIDSRTQNPKALAQALTRLKEAAEYAVLNIQDAEAIRKGESPRRIAALKREEEKRK